MKLLGNLLIGLCILLILTLASVSSSCKKDSDTTVDSVKTSNSDGLQKVLTIPNGSLATGTLPASSTGSNIPVISNYQPSASTG